MLDETHSTLTTTLGNLLDEMLLDSGSWPIVVFLLVLLLVLLAVWAMSDGEISYHGTIIKFVLRHNRDAGRGQADDSD